MLTGPLNLPTSITEFEQYAFSGCSGLTGELISLSIQNIKQYAFNGCSGLSDLLTIPQTIKEIEKYSFNGCTGFRDSLSIDVGKQIPGSGSSNPEEVIIRSHAFNGCSSFKNGKLSIFIRNEEEQTPENTNITPYYCYNYFLRIENEAFEGTKFKNVYYNGRFDLDCDYVIGISQIKGIKTSSNYASKTFYCNPIHKIKLSRGATAGIIIKCNVVIAAIVVLIVFLILKNKKQRLK